MAAEPAGETLPDAPAAEAERRAAAAAQAAADAADRRPWYRRISLALSAFIMSLTITLINAFYAVRGAEIVLLEPDEVLVYRDGEGDRAVLAFAVKVSMINAAGGANGDVLLDAEIQPRADGPRFKLHTTITPVMTDAPDAASRCELGARCISLPNLLIMERSDQVLDIPGGATRVHYLAFTAASWNCVEEGPDCADFGSFEQAIRAMGSGKQDLRVRLKFYADGEREIDCAGGTINLDYLRQIGWTSNAGARCTVSGDNWL